jgi:Ca2+-binding EF-hand superfamily protein
LFDPSGKGFIPGKDLGRALRAMGQNPSESDVASMLQGAVLDGW